MAKQQLMQVTKAEDSNNMRKMQATLVRMVRRARGSAMPDRGCEDFAIKVYFYPLAAALFTEGEFSQRVQRDEITVKSKAAAKWFMEETTVRLQGLLAKEVEVPNTYLSVIVYGLAGAHSFVVHLSADAGASCHIIER